MMRFTPLLALLIALPAAAQDIPARAAVGQCFSACATNLYASDDRVQISVERNRELLWWGIIDQNQFKTAYCVASQNLLIEAEICRFSCLDVKYGYGGQTGDVESLAESAYDIETIEAAQWISSSGLYPNYVSKPRPGTPQFNLACNRFLRVATDTRSLSVSKPPQQANKLRQAPDTEAEN